MSDLEQINKKKLPEVIIAGRPNVGKSTLFNRFIKKRKSITDPTPGVTRDPVSEICLFNNIRVKLTDTGGVKVEQEGLDSFVTDRSLQMMDNADLILFLLDVKEITGEDEIFIEKLRRFSERIILVVNKIDNPEKENEMWNYYSYGFENVIGISSSHGYNIGELEDAVADYLKKNCDVDDTDYSEDEYNVRIAVLGKPNTGKSTLNNLLTGKENSIVSDIPGTTRDIVESSFIYKNIHYQIMDTAGIRRKNKVTENVEYYSVTRAIKTIEDADVVLLVIDGVEGLSDQDKKIASQIVKKGKGVIIVLNKWDLLQKVPNMINAVEDRVRFLFPILDFAPIVPISALENLGIEELLKEVYKVWRQLNTRVSTSSLNKALKDWVEDSPPPFVSGVRYKIRYMTQISANPTKFLLFVNKSKKFPAFYISYIKNKIRKSFGISLIPVDLSIKETKKTWKES